jgi:hypothetical protein
VERRVMGIYVRFAVADEAAMIEHVFWAPRPGGAWKRLGGANRRTRQRGVPGRTPGKLRVARKSDDHIILSLDGSDGSTHMRRPGVIVPNPLSPRASQRAR